jgi:tetratricopeptide (TPR) repeat protein
MPRRLLVSLLVLSLSFVGTPLFAQDPHSQESEAESHYQTAVRLFGEGRYREALDEFDAAIAIRPESIFYCNRAVVLIQLGETSEALDSLETCQETFSGGEAELAEIDAQRQAVEVIVRGIRPSSLETVSGINAPTPVTDTRGPGWNKGSSGYLLIGIGGALLASAATLDLLSADLKQQFVDESTGPRGSTEETYQELRQRYVDRQRIWLGLTAAGGVFTLSGITLLAMHLLGTSTDGGPEVTGLAADGPGLSIRWRW